MNNVTKLLLATDRMSPRQIADYTGDKKKGALVKKRENRHIETVTKEVHGQLVLVERYEQIDPDPTYNHEGFMKEICGASPQRVAEIKAQLQVYKDKKERAVDAYDYYDPNESTESDFFYGTKEENAEIEEAIYRDETAEEYLALDGLEEE